MGKALQFIPMVYLTITAATGFPVIAGTSSAAAAENVDLALVIAVDISASMDVDEQQLQRDGYVDAFRHPDVISAITEGPYGRISVTYVEWAGPNIHTVIVPWTVIAGRDEAEAFGSLLAATPLRRAPGTSISSALLFAGSQFNRRDYLADRLAVDVSGDGANNGGHPVELMRDWLVRRGVTINGLPILLKRDPGSEGYVPDLAAYYEDCVIGGPGAFMIPVDDTASFGTAIRSKLILEIAAVPVLPLINVAYPGDPRIDCAVAEKAF